MRALLVTAGSRGDVEPFALLARRLQSAGHSPRLVVPDNSGVDLDGLEVGSLGVDYSSLVQDLGVSPLASARSFRERVRPAMAQVILQGAREAVETRPDVIVAHPKVLSAPDAAAALGVPYVRVESVPSMTPTREFPAPGVVGGDLGPLNRLTYALAAGAAAMFRREAEQARELLPDRASDGRAPITAALIPVSSVLLPRPADWPDSAHLTGSWIADHEAPPLDEATRQFIEGGPFVYAGFGSMAAGDAAARGRAIVAAARRRALRVLLATGWGGIEVPTDLRGADVHVVESVPHDRVLPRALVAIHHGGAGTVHSVARAGVPQVVVPFIADQPFWGALLERRGLGSAPIRYRRLTEERLVRALGEAIECRPEAAAAADRMRGEDGLGAAVSVLESLIVR
jgi:sterol 3beta-glucosyltransferase